MPHLSQIYQDWQNQTEQLWLLKENSTYPPPSEKILQIIWNEQLFDKPLKLTDGRSLKIASAGTWNNQAGADFLNAHVHIDNEWLNGHIELHRYAADWFQHHHHEDQHYQHVILHVIWDEIPSQKSPPIPTFAIAPHLADNWQQLLSYNALIHYNTQQKIPQGLCAQHWQQLCDATIQHILTHAGHHRLNQKAQRLKLLAQTSTMDQALYELMFESFGYKTNKKAFKTLAAYCDLNILRQTSSDQQRLALLLGTLSLLPDPSCTDIHPLLKETVTQLWHLWWESGLPTSPLTCSFAGRPHNSPERRVWGAWEFFKLTKWTPHRFLLNLALQVQTFTEFYKEFHQLFTLFSNWNHFKNFRLRLDKSAQLIGKSRADDIFVNVIIPWLMLHGNQILWFSANTIPKLPKLQNNHVLTEAAHRFFNPSDRTETLLTNALFQQGLMDLYQTICLRQHTDCSDCPLNKNFFTLFEDMTATN